MAEVFVTAGRVLRYVGAEVDGTEEEAIYVALSVDAPQGETHALNLQITARSRSEAAVWGESGRIIDGVPYDKGKHPGTWHWHTD